MVVANFGVLAYIAIIFRENSASHEPKGVKTSSGDAKSMRSAHTASSQPNKNISELNGFGEASGGSAKVIPETVLEQRQLSEAAPTRTADINASFVPAERKKDVVVVASESRENIAVLPTVEGAQPLPRPWHQLYTDWEQWVQLGTPHGDAWRSPAVIRGNAVFHLPYFVIGGAQKAGTTFLRWLLVQHPLLESGDGLHGEARGEPHFFDWGYP